MTTISPNSWYTRRLIERSEEIYGFSLVEEANEATKRRRLLDFAIIPGKLSAKINDEDGNLRRIEIECSQLTELGWQSLLTKMGSVAIFHAQLLANQLPQNLEELFVSLSLPLFPNEKDACRIIVNNTLWNAPRGAVAAVILKFCESVEADPFALFYLFGRGKEETLLELHKIRHSLFSAQHDSASETQLSGKDGSEIAKSETTLEKFFTLGQSAQNVQFNIRADELPAATLRRLDPIPLSGAEEFTEPLLEQAYEIVARRAQAWGIGL